VRLEGLSKLKKKIHLIGTRSRDLPACTIVSQPTMLLRAPNETKCIIHTYSVCEKSDSLCKVKFSTTYAKKLPQTTFADYLTMLSVSRPYSVGQWDDRTENDLEGRGLIEVLSRSRFEPSTSKIQVWCVTSRSNCSVCPRLNYFFNETDRERRGLSNNGTFTRPPSCSYICGRGFPVAMKPIYVPSPRVRTIKNSMRN
jgi:hypothetical protein